MAPFFHFECALECRLKFVSIWTSLKIFRRVMGLNKQYSDDLGSIKPLLSNNLWIH